MNLMKANLDHQRKKTLSQGKGPITANKNLKISPFQINWIKNPNQ